MYLIDAQGVMEGENLRGEALANKLAELLERLNNHILLWYSDIERGESMNKLDLSRCLHVWTDPSSEIFS